MIERILEYLANNPPGAWAGPLLGIIAFTETLFPPVPGDILFIVISGWALSGGFPFAMAVLYGVTGCFLASGLLFYLGHKPGKQFIESWLKKRVGHERVNRAQAMIADKGPVILAASRFIPGVRSLLVLAAGSSGMRFPLAAISIAFSAVAWYTILSIAGSVLGNNFQAAEGFMKHFEVWIWIIIALLLVIFLTTRIHGKRNKE